MINKFALVVPALRDGGGVPAVANFVYRVAREAGWEVTVISLSSSRHDRTSRGLAIPGSWMAGPRCEAGVWEGRPIVHVGSDFAEFEFARYRSRSLLIPHIRDCRFVQVVSGTAAWAHCVIGLGKPVSLQVATRAVAERAMRVGRERGLMRFWRSAMTRVTDGLERTALYKVDAIQVENNWMLDYIREVTSRSQRDINIRFAPPGVDTQQFSFAPHPRGVDTPFILCVGRLGDPRKNPLLLLEAFALAAHKLPGVKLMTAGVSPPPAEYFERAVALNLGNRIMHVDSPDAGELVSLYQRAIAFALSSEEEGLGIVLLEAMSCGTPVVATRCGGPECIVTDGVDGFLVNRGDPASMAERLVQLCGDSALLAAMGNAAREKIERSYSRGSAGAAFTAVWTTLGTKGDRPASDFH